VFFRKGVWGCFYGEEEEERLSLNFMIGYDSKSQHVKLARFRIVIFIKYCIFKPQQV